MVANARVLLTEDSTERNPEMSTRQNRIGRSGTTGSSGTSRSQNAHERRAGPQSGSTQNRRRWNCDGGWWRCNRSVRSYGLLFLVGTKLADIVTTAIGVRYIPSIIESNPVADHLFAEMGLVTGLTVVGFATVFFAVCAAELFGLEVRRRLGLPKTALFAQASIYLLLSVLFGLVALHNTMLVAEQVTYMLGEMLLSPGAFVG